MSEELYDEPIPADIETVVEEEFSDKPKAYSVGEYNSTVTITDPCFKLEEGDPAPGIRISVLYSTLKGMADTLSAFDNVPVDFYSKEWMASVQNAAGTGIFEDGLDDAMKRDSDWGQFVETEGMRLRAAKPRIAKAPSGTNTLVGQQAIAKITALTSAGTTVQIPLWHSGIWISLKAPPLSAFIELDRRIAMDKTLAGRSTRGLVFSNDSVYMVSHLVDLALQYVFDCNVQNWSPELLRKLILVPDLSFLATGLALTIFPDGHPFSQPCTTDPSKCQHVTKGTVNLAKLMWVDRAKLTDQQRKHMLKRDLARSPSEIAAYQEQWYETKSQVVAITDELKVTFKMPSLDDHIEMGTSWINQIEAATENAFGASLRGEQRETYLINQTQATRIGLYVHWIDKFIIDEGDQQLTIDDRETIEETSKSLSSSPEVSEKIINGAKTFINDRTMSVVGVPNFECPNCKNWHLTEGSPSKTIIPIDAVSNFFTLQQSLIMKRLQR